MWHARAEKPEPGVSAVIVNWNTRDMLAACLEALMAEAGGLLEVIVVDNGSEDGSQEMVRERFPSVVLLANPENVGFGAAANRGIMAARADEVLVLNSDILMVRGALAALHEALASDPHAGLIGAAMHRPDGRVWAPPAPFPTLASMVAANLFLDRLLPPAPRPRHGGSRPVEVAWVPGACFLARRRALIQVGLFDEGFFLYYEDVDLCLRLRGAGARVLFHPGVRVTHEANCATRTNPGIEARAQLEGFRSSVRYARKHFGRMSARLLRLSIRVHALARLAGCSMGGLLVPRSRPEVRRKIGFLRLLATF